MTSTDTHTIRTQQGPRTVQATSPVPGLHVYEIPDDIDTPSPLRWRIGHHSGLLIAAAMYQDDAMRGAEKIADLADWTRDYADLRASVDSDELYLRIGWASCEHPARA